MSNVRKYRAPALEKGLRVLDFLCRTPESMTITEICHSLDYSSGEIFRILQVLEDHNFIRKGKGDTGYELTNRLFLLAMERPANRNLVEVAQPIMHNLAEEISQPCHLVVQSREHMVVVARAESPGDLGFIVRIGHRRPIAHSTSGLVLFAFQTVEGRERWLALLDQFDAGYNKRKFIEEADVVAADRFAKRPSDVINGVLDLSAPILDQSHAIGALAIPFIEHHTSQVTIDGAIEHLINAADEISKNWQVPV